MARLKLVTAEQETADPTIKPAKEVPPAEDVREHVAVPATAKEVEEVLFAKVSNELGCVDT